MRQKYVFFVGIDVSKEWFDAAFSTDGDVRQMIHGRFHNNAEGFLKFLAWLRSLSGKKRLSKKQFFVCMEHTGVYTLPLCRFLQKNKLAYAILPGLEIKNSMGIRRGKSDKSDSKNIARYAFMHRNELTASQLPCEELLLVKNLLAFRDRLRKYRDGLKTAASELKGFSLPAQSRSVVDDTNTITTNINKRIKRVEKQILEVIQEHEELKRLYDLATSVKGIGLIIGATLLVHTNAFQNFQNARKFASYCCIAPFEQSSGKSIHKKAKVSKLGNRKIKALLTNAARNVIRTDKELKAYFERKTADGKNEHSVLNAVKFKLVARVFAVVKRGTPFTERDTYRS